MATKKTKTNLVEKNFKSSLYFKIDDNNIKIILEIQRACFDIARICADQISRIRLELKETPNVFPYMERKNLLEELVENVAMLQKAAGTFKSVQPESTRDISEAMLVELTKIKEGMEKAEEKAKEKVA